MRKTLAYAMLALGVLSVLAGNTLIHRMNGHSVKVADITPFPPH